MSRVTGSEIGFTAGLPQTRERSLRVLAVVAVVGAVLAAALLWACARPALAAAEGPPPLQSAYEGSYSDEYVYDTGKGEKGSREANFSWAGSGLYTAADATAEHASSLQPVTFSKVSGRKVERGQLIYCKSSPESPEETNLEASILENPMPEDWYINETSGYPEPGWQYELSDSVFFVPIMWTGKQGINTPCEEPRSEFQRVQVNELPGGFAGVSSGACPMNEKEKEEFEKEREELLANLYVAPGASGGQTRKYHHACSGTFKGEGSWKYTITIVLTVGATSPGTSNAINPPASGGGGGTSTSPSPSPSSSPAQKPVSERRRAEIKEQAKADLKPALESAWQGHGLLTSFGLALGFGLSEAADSIGGAATVIGNANEIVRVVNDYRIVKDPPAPEYEALAEPAAAKAPALPSCRHFRSKKGVSSYCKALRAAAASLVAQSGTTAAIDEAMYTTISRDTAAIDAGAYAAAESQASHFAALRTQFEAALTAQGRAGASVAGLLRKAHIDGSLTKARSAKAIKWLEGQLSSHGIAPSEVDPLAPGALAAKRVSAFATLANPLS